MILGAKRLRAKEALRWGLADVLAVGESGLREQFDKLAARAVQQGKRSHKGMPLRTWKQWFIESNAIGRRLIFKGAERLLKRRVPDDMPAPAEALEAVRTGIKSGMEAGMAQERAAAGRLATSSACRNLIGLFFQRELARKAPLEARQDHRPEVRRVGIVGAGVMGAGIAQLAALKGFEVVIQEVNEMALGAGLMRVESLFRKAVERGLLTQNEADRRLSVIQGTIEWKGFDTVHLVVEAASENPDAKRSLFRTLEAMTRPETVLATNTSSLSVTRLQEGLRHPRARRRLAFLQSRSPHAVGRGRPRRGDFRGDDRSSGTLGRPCR